jgi:hypothetical protein
MTGEVILKNDLTHYGLRRLHVLQMGKPVKDDWIKQVPFNSIKTCISTSWVNEAVDIYHLFLCWKVREVVQIQMGDTLQEVVMWWIDVKEGETIRKCADDAACLFSLLHTWLPTKAAVRKLPPSAKGKKLDEPFQDVVFIEEPWVPTSCVAVW